MSLEGPLAVVALTHQTMGGVHLRVIDGDLTRDVADVLIDSLAKLGYRTIYIALEKGADPGVLPVGTSARIRSGDGLDHYRIETP